MRRKHKQFSLIFDQVLYLVWDSHEPLAGLFDCGANRVHGTALLKYRGSPPAHTSSPFDGPTNYADYINIKGIKGKPNQIIQPLHNWTFLKYIYTRHLQNRGAVM
jgi:hypothetical protein